MQSAQNLVDLTPLARVLLIGACVALIPLLWTLRRQRGAPWLPALAVLTLFLTFDLVVFGAYTRLTDSGLGCPDWPGCYGHGSPVGAQAPIADAQAAQPTGPVTAGKAWIEMIHRYLATAVGGLIAVLAVAHIGRALRRRRPAIPDWTVATLCWVAVQGAFGALTVTWKLYPAIVTAHLLGGLTLLALLAVVNERQAGRSLVLDGATRRGIWIVFGLCVAQVALGGWVSTNDAVLACTDLPACRGAQWWPPTDFRSGFDPAHDLGRTRDGADLTLAALTAIHLAHRLGAVVFSAASFALIARLAWLPGKAPRRWAALLAALLAAQVGSGLVSVLLGWPMATALAHSAGAAGWVAALAALLARTHAADVTEVRSTVTASVRPWHGSDRALRQAR